MSLVASVGVMILLAVVSGSVSAQPTNLFSFDNTSGAEPYGDLTLSGSTLYGMTYGGGANGCGTIFAIPTSGGSPTILFSFDGAAHGANPQGSLTLSGSTLYGMTTWGGTDDFGTIFRIPTSGGSPTILFSFDGAHGIWPYGSLALSGSTLYGMASGGGKNGFGTIFSVATSGGVPTVLFNFNGSLGGWPQGALTLSGSTLYGMTRVGDSNDDGVIFSLPTSGGTPKILFNFDGTNGENPYGSLTLSGSTLYGMTYGGGANNEGTIFSLSTSGGTPTILFSFDGTTHGANPWGSLTLSGSTLYGMATWGGTDGYGTIFRIPTSGGTPTTLFSFDDTNGDWPHGSLALSGSTLYGMSYEGGASNEGTIFSIPTVMLEYTVTASPATGGTATVSPSQATYDYGDTPTVTATASPGYAFANWTVTGGTLSSSTAVTASLTVQGNVTLTANYTQNSYSGTEAVTGGTISLSSSGPYVYGQVITATETASAGYAFAGWSVTGPSTLSSSSAVTTSLTVYDSFTLTANFRQETFSVTALTSTTWVYQNTPLSTQDRHVLALTVSVMQDTWGNSGYTTTVTQSGSGVVTPVASWTSGTTVTPTLSASWAGLSGYLVGGRVNGVVNGAANLALTGSCLVTVSVVGNVSGPTNPATATVTIVVRPLGDIDGSGQLGGQDLTILNTRLNGLGIAPQTDADCDLSGDGRVTTADRVILYIIRNDQPVP
jgi:uncharacterized repeat protein (TIGR02543 family)